MLTFKCSGNETFHGKAAVGCLPLPLPVQGGTEEQYTVEQPDTPDSFGNKMALVPESTKPPQLGDYVTLQPVIHQNPETNLTQRKKNQ